MTDYNLKRCPLCDGNGVVIKSDGKNSVGVVCPVCGGSGKVAESATSRRQHIYKYCGDQYLE